MSEPASSPSGATEVTRSGVLAWFAQNHVAANLIMAGFIVGGLMLLPTIKREVFPEFELDMVTVVLPYPGASPEEVEQGVVLAAEEAVRAVDGVKEVRSTANEGAGTVSVELLAGSDRDRALADVKSSIDRISSLPADAERPIVSLATRRRSVLSVIVYGDIGEKALRAVTERVRDGLLSDPGITQAELYGERPLEISIEVPEAKLRAHGLTLEQIAQAIRAASVELPAGGVKTGQGEVLVRMAERRDRGREFENIIIAAGPAGTELRLSEIATIHDAFSETDQEAFFNGKRAQRIEVYRIGDEGPIEVSEAVHTYLEEHAHELPPGVATAVWGDRSELYQQRQDLMLRNAAASLTLVLLVLGLFLEVRLAFWVTLGIPTAFIGTFLFMNPMDVSINMISMFAFIVTLGIVVDDAIVVGEAFYKHRRDGLELLDAAIAGVREVARPVTFSIITTIVAFLPLLFVPGPAGNFFRNIPLVVISVLAVSLAECLWTLPAHLADIRHPLARLASVPFKLIDAPIRAIGRFSLVDKITGWQQAFSRKVEWFIDNPYRSSLSFGLRNRYLTMAVGIGSLALTLGLVGSGRVPFTFLPKIDGDVVSARLELPFGSPVALTREYQQTLLRTAREALEEAGGEAKLSRGILSEVGGVGALGNTAGGRERGDGGHVADVMVFLVPPDDRPGITSSEFARRWRQRVGEIPGAERLSFNFSTGHGSGPPVSVRLRHPDPDTLERSAERLANEMRGYAGTYDIDDGTKRGKAQLDLALRPEARALGLTQTDLGRQVRSAFYGAEALRQQRGREEIRVFVRRPLEERQSEHDIESLLVRTPQGGEIPLGRAAVVTRNRAYTSIARTEGRRTIDVVTDVDPAVGNPEEIMRGLVDTTLPQLMADIPGLTYTLEGQGRERAEMMAALGRGFMIAVLAMYVLLAVAFRSYAQPFIVLLAIPFGMIGAVIGHMIMGYDLSLMTMFGVVALAGVVVNDSLVLVDIINRYRSEGMSTLEAVVAGARRRFRPILLTSLTTFFGLMPLIFETSMQARFLIPMAISLGFGVMFATLLTLGLVPAAYLILDDLRTIGPKISAALRQTAAAGE